MSEPKICIGIEKNAKDTDKVEVGYFKCKASKNMIAATAMPATYSPFSNRFMSTASEKTVEMPISEVRNSPLLTSIGSCPVCEMEHYVSKASINDFVEDGQDMHCTQCGTEYTPVIASELLESDDNDFDEEDDEIPTVAADDDDDDDDDDDSEDEDDNFDDDDDDDDDNNDNEDEVPAVVPPESKTPIIEQHDPDNKPEVVAPPVAEETGNDMEHDGELVSLSGDMSEFNIDCLATAGDLNKAKLVLVPVNPKFALVLANEMPVLKLYADKAGKNAEIFNDPNRLARAFTAIVQASNNPDFSTIGGESITYTVNVDQQINKKVNEKVTAATTALAEEKTTISKEIRGAISTAALIVNKNMEKNTVNPLRQGFISALTQRNYSQSVATDLVDSILKETADSYFQTVLSKSDDLMSRSLEERNTIARFMNDANYNTVTAHTTDTQESERARFSKDLEQHSVVISTTANGYLPESVSTASSIDDEVAAVRNKFFR